MITKSSRLLLLLAAWLVHASPLRAAPQTSEVPLELYTDAWPAGVAIGPGFGVSFLDYDRDGWVDLYSHFTGTLWRNEHGLTWSLAADLDTFLPATVLRYGSTCGDFDNDGLPDIATENYNRDCFYLLKNLGQGSFVEIASDPRLVIGQPCNLYSETACWADVDDDREIEISTCSCRAIPTSSSRAPAATPSGKTSDPRVRAGLTGCSSARRKQAS